MIKVLSIGSDRKLFEPGSAVRARAIEYGALFDELHIVVFSLKRLNLKKLELAKNVWVYPTNSRSRFFYVRDAVRLETEVVRHGGNLAEWVVTTQDPFESGLAGLKIARRLGLKLHVQIHSDFLSPYFKKHSFLNQVRLRIARKVLPAADGIRVVSIRIIDSLKAAGLRLKAIPTVLPIFVDAEKFTSASRDGSQMTFPWRHTILVASRLEPEKDVELAIRVLKKIAAKHPDTGLVIVGDGSCRKELANLVGRLKLGRNVLFEGWQDNLMPYYQSADIFFDDVPI